MFKAFEIGMLKRGLFCPMDTEGRLCLGVGHGPVVVMALYINGLAGEYMPSGVGSTKMTYNRCMRKAQDMGFCAACDDFGLRGAAWGVVMMDMRGMRHRSLPVGAKWDRRQPSQIPKGRTNGAGRLQAKHLQGSRKYRTQPEFNKNWTCQPPAMGLICHDRHQRQLPNIVALQRGPRQFGRSEIGRCDQAGQEVDASAFPTGLSLR